MNNPFLDALGSDGPAPGRAGKMDLYGRFIGSWDLEVTRFNPDGSRTTRPGEWHFGWALEGRAVQDVWIVPPRGSARNSDAVTSRNSYGTTLRTYDPSIDAWHIQWTDPVTQTYLSMIGRSDGDNIVQLGKDPQGDEVRWSFSKITPNSFLWRGESSTDAGKTWTTVVEFTAQRRLARPA